MLFTTRSAAVGVGNLVLNIVAKSIYICLPNIYFNILEYLSTVDLLSFCNSDL